MAMSSTTLQPRSHHRGARAAALAASLAAVFARQSCFTSSHAVWLCSLSSSGRVSSCRGGPSDSFRRLGQTSGLWSLGRLAESGTTASTAEAEEDADGDDDGSADEQAPHVGRRLRVWFLNEDDDRSDYEYGTVIEDFQMKASVATRPGVLPSFAAGLQPWQRSVLLPTSLCKAIALSVLDALTSNMDSRVWEPPGDKEDPLGEVYKAFYTQVTVEEERFDKRTEQEHLLI
ncbi:unnamed protein product [Polarella glacialis]|uniref:Uncharacterized protein n=1 Tax=Polarella glacialis TaxID=89957 RepID=A0A813ECB2_POLGL|nr:unnamed protein product [Polarella glacialis]